MKRSEWENLVANNNGRHIGTSTILGYPIYAISDDMGYHKNKHSLPAYVCEITEEDAPLINANGISKVTYPMYICIPTKIMFDSDSIPRLHIQILGMIAIDSHMRGINGPLEDTMRLLEMWAKPHNIGVCIELLLQNYCAKIKED